MMFPPQVLDIIECVSGVTFSQGARFRVRRQMIPNRFTFLQCNDEGVSSSMDAERSPQFGNEVIPYPRDAIQKKPQQIIGADLIAGVSDTDGVFI